MDPVVRKEYSLSLKVHEAKDLNSDVIHGCDPYAVVLIDHKEVARTKTVWNNREPVWDEDSFFDLRENFSIVNVVVWDQNRRFKDIPLGKITLSKIFLAQHVGGGEQWIPLASADTEGTVTGDVQLELSYYPPTATVPMHTLNVTVINARNLIPKDTNGLSDPYVVLHLLPDPEAESTKHTRIIHKTLSPEYMETFCFTFDFAKELEQMVLHVSVWDWDRFSEDEFMGHISIPLSDLNDRQTLLKYFPLLPSPVSIKMPGTVDLVEGKILSMIKPIIKRQSRKASFNYSKTPTQGHSPDLSKGKNFVKSFQTLSSSESIVDKPRGTIRVYYNFQEERILPHQYYIDLLNVVSGQNYLLASLLGKWSSHREEAARSLITFFEFQDQATKYLCGVLDQEVCATIDPNTIFRGNSMASKSLDIYMKLTAMPYLQHVLGGIIKEIITSKQNCELDPTRLEKPEDAPRNLSALLGYCEAIIEAIFKSVHSCPVNLRKVFCYLQNRVRQRFPQNENVQYTAISGFIFLRFFCPAILGPTLFDLWSDSLEKTQIRSLTLIAKTIQNLGNLVEFGMKEPYMKDVNPFILSKMEGVKKFIDQISVDDNLKMAPSVIEPKTFDVAKQCARIHHYFDECRNKILENSLEHEKVLVMRLVGVLDEINNALNTVENKIQKKKEAERATRVSLVSQLANSEGKVSIKPAGQSSIAALDNLLDDLENYHVKPQKSKSRSSIISGVASLIKRPDSSTPQGKRESISLQRHPSTNEPKSPSSPRTPSDDFKFSSSSNILEKLGDSARKLIEPTKQEPIIEPTKREIILPEPIIQEPIKQDPIIQEPIKQPILPKPIVQEPIKQEPIKQEPEPIKQEPIKQEPIKPKPEIINPKPIVQEPIKQEPIKQNLSDNFDSNKKSAMDSLDDLLADLSSVAFDESSVSSNFNNDIYSGNSNRSSTNNTTNTNNSSNEMSIEEIIRQATEAAKRTSSALENRSSQTPKNNQFDFSLNQKPQEIIETPPPPPKDDLGALDDLMDSFNEAAADAIHQNEANECVFCKGPINESTWHSWAGFKWHAQHFNCSICKVNLEGQKFFFHDNELFCNDDYQRVFTCASCGLNIDDQIAEALGKKYHFSCFCCSVCESPITDVFHLDEHGNLLCKEDWLIKNEMFCAICQNHITGGYVTIGVNKFHPECLVCQQCGESIAGREYIVIDNHFYCSSHYRCAACNQAIGNQVVNALGKKYHPHHFTCKTCKKSLLGEPFYEKDQHPICGGCYNLMI